MAFKLLALHLITALIAVNLIFAEEESDRFFGLPFFGGGNDSSGFLAGLPFIPNLPFFGSGQQLPFGSRQERSADEEDTQERLFFSSVISCNYTTQGGTTCSGCRQSLACYPNNVGRLRTCRGLTRYCNSGRCSFIPGTQCTNTTNTTAA